MDKQKLVAFLSEMIEKEAFLTVHAVDLHNEHIKARSEAIELGERISEILEVPAITVLDHAFDRVTVETLNMRFTFSYLKKE